MPLALIFGKQCKGFCTYCGSIQWGIFYTSCGTYMGSNVFHSLKGSVIKGKTHNWLRGLLSSAFLLIL
jgi:hypothetical protein